MAKCKSHEFVYLSKCATTFFMGFSLQMLSAGKNISKKHHLYRLHQAVFVRYVYHQSLTHTFFRDGRPISYLLVYIEVMLLVNNLHIKRR